MNCGFIVASIWHGGAMRKLGPQPLTGAEKQRRHRERVKARLAEAERLKALLVSSPGNGLPGLSAVYDHILDELGAAFGERETLRAQVGGIQSELMAVLEARARNDLEHLRAKRHKRKSSLLSSLDTIKPHNEGQSR
jgi:hypothetical protein